MDRQVQGINSHEYEEGEITSTNQAPAETQLDMDSLAQGSTDLELVHSDTYAESDVGTDSPTMSQASTLSEVSDVSPHDELPQPPPLPSAPSISGSRSPLRRSRTARVRRDLISSSHSPVPVVWPDLSRIRRARSAQSKASSRNPFQ